MFYCGNKTTFALTRSRCLIIILLGDRGREQIKEKQKKEKKMTIDFLTRSIKFFSRRIEHPLKSMKVESIFLLIHISFPTKLSSEHLSVFQHTHPPFLIGAFFFFIFYLKRFLKSNFIWITEKRFKK